MTHPSPSPPGESELEDLRKAKEGVEALLCDAQAEIAGLRAMLSALVEAYEQEDGLNPTVRLVQAMRDARSWLKQNT